MFHADIDGRPNLALATLRPIEMEVLFDMTPSAGSLSRQLWLLQPLSGAALPTFKLLNQINLKNRSRRAAALDLVQRHIVFEQDDGKDLNWAVLRKTLLPDAGPGTVSVKDLKKPTAEPGLSARRDCAPAEGRAEASEQTPGKDHCMCSSCWEVQWIFIPFPSC
jgi:hypothetical protein